MDCEWPTVKVGSYLVGVASFAEAIFMSTAKLAAPAEPQEPPKDDGAAAELSDEAIHNLTGFFDVLIQMDLALKQRNERKAQNDKHITDGTN